MKVLLQLWIEMSAVRPLKLYKLSTLMLWIGSQIETHGLATQSGALFIPELTHFTLTYILLGIEGTLIGRSVYRLVSNAKTFLFRQLKYIYIYIY